MRFILKEKKVMKGCIFVKGIKNIIGCFYIRSKKSKIFNKTGIKK